MAVSRREFLATSGAVLVALDAARARALDIDRAESDTWQYAAAEDAVRAETADAALTRASALGASYADIRINRYRRESIATRERQVQNVSRSTSRGLGVRVLVTARGALPPPIASSRPPGAPRRNKRWLLPARTRSSPHARSSSPTPTRW